MGLDGKGKSHAHAAAFCMKLCGGFNLKQVGGQVAFDGVLDALLQHNFKSQEVDLEAEDFRRVASERLSMREDGGEEAGVGCVPPRWRESMREVSSSCLITESSAPAPKFSVPIHPCSV